ncbi:MAG: alpha-amylase family glycosyl hydrolase, partial [Roseiflexus sp.]
MSHHRHRRGTVLLALIGMLLTVVALPGALPVARASDTPDPSSVTIAGSFQSELGCPGDWQPECAITRLVYDAADQVWQATFTIPAGTWEYKAALNGSWDENYGANAQRNGANIPLTLSAAASVRFYYDHETHWVVSDRNTRIVTAPGNYQSELGCPGDWQPDCLRSWLQDPDGDGVFVRTVTGLPAGNYEFKIAIHESWSENYGAGGAPGGANIPFTVPAPGYRVTFTFVSATNTPSVAVVSAGAQPDNNVEWDGVRHDSRDPLYRVPGGAVPAGTPVTIRLRTFHNDVTSVRLRVYDLNASAQRFYDMAPTATDVDCYEASPAGKTCDFWEVTLTQAAPNNLWYRFIVTDGTDTDY